jgi:hypothetical protein
MTMRKLLIPFLAAALLLLPACSTQSDPKVASIENLATVCDGIAGAVNTLAAARANRRLSPGQIALVNELEPVARAVCSDPPPLDKITALQKARAALAQMTAIAANQGVR